MYAWSPRLWPQVDWNAETTTTQDWLHISTQVLGSCGHHGQTLWGGLFEEGDAAVGWDWVQLAPGVVALADPLSVTSNMRLLGPTGSALSPGEAARRLNEVVHSLPWQEQVGRVLASQ